MSRRPSTFRRGFASTLVLNVVARGLSAIALVLLLRSLEVDSFAYVVLFINVGQFAGSALTGGIRERYMRVEAERVSRGSSEQTGFALAWAASMGLVLAIAALCVVILRLLEPPSSGHDPILFVALATAFTAAHSSIELAMFHHRAHLSFTLAGVIDVARGGAMLVAALIAGFGLTGSGAIVAAWTAGATLAVALVACLPLARATLRARPIAAIAGDFGRESAWLTCFYLASASFSYATIFVIAALLNDEAIASYGAAARYMAFIYGPFPALMAVMRVRTSQEDVVDSAHVQLSMFARWVKQTLPPSVVVLALTAAAAPLIIPVIDGGRYPDSVPIFQILLISALLQYGTMPAPNLLMSQRRYELLAGVYLIAMPVHVAVLVVASSAGVIAVAAASIAVRIVEVLTVTYLAIRGLPRGSPHTDVEAEPSETHSA
jgi:O-antigen/teichoic acid export membrane protein